MVLVVYRMMAGAATGGAVKSAGSRVNDTIFS
jgi:hypothetical protein